MSENTNRFQVFWFLCFKFKILKPQAPLFLKKMKAPSHFWKSWQPSLEKRFVVFPFFSTVFFEKLLFSTGFFEKLFLCLALVFFWFRSVAARAAPEGISEKSSVTTAGRELPTPGHTVATEVLEAAPCSGHRDLCGQRPQGDKCSVVRRAASIPLEGWKLRVLQWPQTEKTNAMRNVITLSLVVRRRTIKVQVHCAADGIKTTSGKVMTKKKRTKRNETKRKLKTKRVFWGKGCFSQEGGFLHPKKDDSHTPQKVFAKSRSIREMAQRQTKVYIWRALYCWRPNDAMWLKL